MADLEPIDQEAPGQPVVTAPTILTGARLNPALDTRQGSRFCARPCEVPQGFPRACTPNYEENISNLREPNVGDRQSFTFQGFDWTAVDEEELDNCDGDDMEARLAEIAAASAAYMIGRELDAAPLTANPSLQTHSLDIAPGIIAHPADSVAMLMHASAKVGQYRSTFVAADHSLPTFLEAGLVTLVNGQWRLAGRPIIFSPGISGLGPAGFDPGPGAAYLYLLSGSIDYNVNQGDFEASAAAHRQNTRLAISQSSAIVRFNPMCVHAVAVCLTHASCCAGDADAMGNAAAGKSGSVAPAITALQDADEFRTQARAAAGLDIAKQAAEAAAQAADAQRQRQAEADAALAAEQAVIAADVEAEQSALETAAQEASTATSDQVAVEAERAEVPDGNIADILEWVDGDHDKALAAVTHEAEHRNRSTLISALNEIVEG